VSYALLHLELELTPGPFELQCQAHILGSPYQAVLDGLTLLTRCHCDLDIGALGEWLQVAAVSAVYLLSLGHTIGLGLGFGWGFELVFGHGF